MFAQNKRQQPQPASMSTGAMPVADQKQADPIKRYLRQNIRQNYLVMSSARLDSALASDSPFVERLMHFWANHFAVSVDKLPVIGLAGLLEFEAIRPHVLGRFSDMLLAVEQHPAMLVYLDQAQSIGPNSRAGQFAQRAAASAARPQRESRARDHGAAHARRAQRLQPGRRHRVRPRADRLDRRRDRRGPAARHARQAAAGEFQFADLLHEPGDRTIMGKRYGQAAKRRRARS